MWTRQDADEYIRANYPQQLSSAIAEFLTQQTGEHWRSSRVRTRAQRIGVAGIAGNGGLASFKRRLVPRPRKTGSNLPFSWTPEAVAKLLELREAGASYAECAHELGCSVGAAHQKIKAVNGLLEPKPALLPKYKPPPPTIRHKVELLHNEQQRTRGGIRCVCGKPGTPVHCERHSKMMEMFL